MKGREKVIVFTLCYTKLTFLENLVERQLSSCMTTTSSAMELIKKMERIQLH